MSDHGIEYRLLEVEHWQQWKEVRLQALRDCPGSFTASYEEECDKEDSFFISNVQNSSIFGAFIGDKLVSTVGLSCHTQIKMRHRGYIFGVFTIPEARGKGITKVLMNMAIAFARDRKLTWLLLDVVTGNDAAVKLYEKLGFQIIGNEPRSLMIGDSYVDQHIMALNID